MPAVDNTDRGRLSVRILIGIYRYLPLPLYAILWLGYRAFPFIRPLMRERMGMAEPPPGGGPLVWFHGASVGEVSSIGPVVEEIRERVPGCRIIVTTMTATGRKRASEELEGAGSMVVPLDFFPAVRRFVTALKPALLIVGETEIWPNLVMEARRGGASVVLVNGRISDKSFPKYRFLRPFFEYVLDRFDLLLMRGEVDAKRFAEIGGPVDRIRVVGNTKVDILPHPLPADKRTALKERLGIGSSRLVISLGSARTGESEILLDAVASAFEKPRPLVIIAPRHINIAPQIEDACRMRGLSFITTPGQAPGARAETTTEVIIVGEMGRLLGVYAISDIAVVGGTFKPLGGHNPLEPVSQGTVTVVGRHIHNIADDIDYLQSRGVAFVTDEAGLGGLLRDLADDTARRDEIAVRAVEVVRNRKGIAAECVDMMAGRDLLP